ncbi:unnamed protein product [Ambrosiozyma monospora]|uniref:Unnamed protein product n=1 Tax=Ambrosiozyma monospora TaxID=43982 RepID=A0ACB5T5Q1_AMBMO|nr:unnamed protein product [Ambrosiozyma monospora]
MQQSSAATENSNAIGSPQETSPLMLSANETAESLHKTETNLMTQLQAKKDRHIHFNMRVDQCIAIDQYTDYSTDYDYDSDELEYQNSSMILGNTIYTDDDYPIDDDDDEDDDEDDTFGGFELNPKPKAGAISHRPPGSSSTSSSLPKNVTDRTKDVCTISPLPATTLKICSEDEEDYEDHMDIDRPDSPSPLLQAEGSQGIAGGTIYGNDSVAVHDVPVGIQSELYLSGSNEDVVDVPLDLQSEIPHSPSNYHSRSYSDFGSSVSALSFNPPSISHNNHNNNNNNNNFGGNLIAQQVHSSSSPVLYEVPGSLTDSIPHSDYYHNNFNTGIPSSIQQQLQQPQQQSNMFDVPANLRPDFATSPAPATSSNSQFGGRTDIRRSSSVGNAGSSSGLFRSSSGTITPSGSVSTIKVGLSGLDLSSTGLKRSTGVGSKPQLFQLANAPPAPSLPQQTSNSGSRGSFIHRSGSGFVGGGVPVPQKKNTFSLMDSDSDDDDASFSENHESEGEPQMINNPVNNDETSDSDSDDDGFVITANSSRRSFSNIGNGFNGLNSLNNANANTNTNSSFSNNANSFNNNNNNFNNNNSSGAGINRTASVGGFGGLNRTSSSGGLGGGLAGLNRSASSGGLGGFGGRGGFSLGGLNNDDGSTSDSSTNSSNSGSPMTNSCFGLGGRSQMPCQNTPNSSSPTPAIPNAASSIPLAHQIPCPKIPMWRWYYWW